MGPSWEGDRQFSLRATLRLRIGLLGLKVPSGTLNIHQQKLPKRPCTHGSHERSKFFPQSPCFEFALSNMRTRIDRVRISQNFWRRLIFAVSFALLSVYATAKLRRTKYFLIKRVSANAKNLLCENLRKYDIGCMTCKMYTVGTMLGAIGILMCALVSGPWSAVTTCTAMLFPGLLWMVTYLK